MSAILQADPCNIVIFGASGDLTRRKLLPALARMHRWNLLAPDSRIIGVMRDSSWHTERWQSYVHASLEEFHPDSINDNASWQSISTMLELTIGDLTDASMYQRLRENMKSSNRRTNALFYLAIPPHCHRKAIRQ